MLTERCRFNRNIAGLVCYWAVALKNKLRWDDALDVWGVHGVGGTLGIIILGIFGTVTINAAGSNGLLHGGAEFFKVQLSQYLSVQFTLLYLHTECFG